MHFLLEKTARSPSFYAPNVEMILYAIHLYRFNSLFQNQKSLKSNIHPRHHMRLCLLVCMSTISHKIEIPKALNF